MSFLAASLTFFLIQDPIGNIPITLSLLRLTPPKRRIWIIIRENLIALLISSIFLIQGKTILQIIQVNTEALGIVGGIILFSVAFKMTLPMPEPENHLIQPVSEPFIVPLAIPLLSGPSMISTLILFSNQHPQQLFLGLCSLLLVTFFSTIILLLSIPLYKLLGANLLKAVERLMGIILMAIATQILLDNLISYIKYAFPR
jgi:multiple antibiotic resistance protein